MLRIFLFFCLIIRYFKVRIGLFNIKEKILERLDQPILKIIDNL